MKILKDEYLELFQKFSQAFNTSILQVRSDNLFNYLFNRRNKFNLEWMMSKILDIDYLDIKGKIKVLNLKNSNLLIEYDGIKYLFKVNNYFRENMKSNTNTSDIFDINMNKNEVQKIVIINLNWYYYENDYKNIDELLMPLKEEMGFRYLLKIVNINLDYYANIEYNKLTNKEMFYKLLTLKTFDELEDFVSNYKNLNNYQEEIKAYSLDNQKRFDFFQEYLNLFLDKTNILEGFYELGIVKGKNDVLNKMRKKYRIKEKESKINLIKELYNDKTSFKRISKYTKMNVSNIKKIIAKEAS